MKVYLGAFFALTGLCSAHADLNSLAEKIAANPDIAISTTTKSTQDVITIEVDNEVIQATADDFVNAVRAKIPAQTLQSGDYKYEIGWNKLTATKQSEPGGTVVIYDILADIKANQYDPTTADQSQQAMDGYINERIKLLSVVGPYVSYNLTSSTYAPGTAHPNDFEGIIAMNVAQHDSYGLSVANLLDVVNEASLVKALKADRFLKKFAKTQKARKALSAATTVAQISEALSAELVNRCYSFPEIDNRVSSFAIYGYNSKADLMSVRLSLGASAHVCQGMAPTVQIGVQVQPLPEMTYLLRRSVQGSEGQLMSKVAR